jgi:Arc/MetJ family transcription regulator
MKMQISASIDATIHALAFRIERRPAMRTTLAIDDELLSKAQALTGVTEKSTLVREALKALIARESALRLARLGGSEPQLTPIRRRRPDQ